MNGKKLFFIIFWSILTVIFFSPVLKGKIPAPLDTIVGLYHPWREVVWDKFTSGVPFKNFLITDPVRQQIPYKYLTVEKLKEVKFFSWNPYSFSGTPLSANIQSGYYYPLNLLFFIFPFLNGWTIFIILAPLLAGIFIYNYLRFFKLNQLSCAFGALIFAFSGFFIAWLEWGTITHVILWLPLILLAKEKLLQKLSFRWFIILIIAEVSQLLAGHLQLSFYVIIFSTVYLLLRIFQYAKNGNLKIYLSNFIKKSIPFVIIPVLVVLIVSIQYIPLIRYINLSARLYDLPNWQTSPWFLPWKHLVQLIIPDFFGNPSTLNYWGEWNYGEFVSFIGILPLFFVLYAIFFRKDKKVSLYSLATVVIILLVTPHIISRIPYLLKIPYFSTAQPTRLISLLDFNLAVLAALGLDHFIRVKPRSYRTFMPIIIIGLILVVCWGFVVFGKGFLSKEIVDPLLLVTKRNLYLPTAMVLLSSILIVGYIKFKNNILIYFIFLITIFDLFRFGWKYISFSNNTWFYPPTAILNFLQNQEKPFRLMSLDRRILPPNFSMMYKLEDVSGYDPLYLLNYAKLVQAWTTDTPDINPGKFNRIITPQNYESFITDMMNVRFVLSLTEIESPKLILRLQEGQTRLYENSKAFPRVYFTEKVYNVINENEEIKLMFNLGADLISSATIKENIEITDQPLESDEKINLLSYDENTMVIKTQSNYQRLLVISEIFYPSWKGYIDGKPINIYPVDLALRGVVVPQGEHIIKFRYQEF